MVGFLDPWMREQAAYQGLLGLGAGLLQAGAPQTRPTSFMGGVGQGALGFNQGYQGALNNYMKMKLGEQQYGLQELQLKTTKEKLEREKEARENFAKLFEPSISSAEAQTGTIGPTAANANALDRGGLPFGLTPEQARLAKATGTVSPEKGFSTIAEYMKANQKPPEVVEFFNTEGRPQKYQWDRRKMKYEPIGGAESKLLSPAEMDQKIKIAQASRTNINVDTGTIPPGYQLTVDPKTGTKSMVPIPGSPAAQKVAQAAEAKAEQQAATERQGDLVINDIARVRDKIKTAAWYSPTAGFFGNVLKDVAGTRSADVKALVSTVKSNIGFDRLQAMREASPTGGALGQVSERELGFLQATLGNLEQSQSEDQLLENLDRLDTIYRQILKKAAAYPNAAEFGFAEEQEKPAESDNPYAKMSDEEVLESLRQRGLLK